MSDIDRRRFEAAAHEASHLIVAFINELPVHDVRIVGLDGKALSVGGYACDGYVQLGGPGIGERDLIGAIQRIQVAVAGHCGVMIAVANGFFPDELLGGKKRTEADDDEDIVAAVMAAATPDQMPERRAAHLGWWQDGDSPDEAQARHLAELVTTTPPEADALLRFCRERTLSALSTRWASAALEKITGALLDLGHLEGGVAVGFDHQHEIHKLEGK